MVLATETGIFSSFLRRTDLITGAPKATNCKEFEFHRRKIPATPKLDETNKNDVDDRTNPTKNFFSTPENEMLGIV